MSRKDSDELDSVSASFALDFEACQLLRDAQTCAESRGVWADAAQEARQALDLLDLLPSRATFH